MSADATNRTDVDEPNYLVQAYRAGGYEGWLRARAEGPPREVVKYDPSLSQFLTRRDVFGYGPQVSWPYAFRNALQPEIGDL